MTDLAWMKTYIGDEAALTGHLTAEEFGAYERLRRHYWQHGSLPDDDARLTRITAVTTDRWPLVRTAIEPLFAEGRLLQKLDQVRADAAGKRERKVLAGQKGAQKRWGDRAIVNGNTNGYANGTPNSKSMAEPMAEPLVTQWPPAPAPEEVRYEEELVPTRTHTGAREELIPVPASRKQGSEWLMDQGVFPFDFDELLDALMAGTLTKTTLRDSVP